MLSVTKSLPLPQHERDQGAEQRRVRRMLSGILDAEESFYRLLWLTDQGKGGKMPRLPHRVLSLFLLQDPTGEEDWRPLFHAAEQQREPFQFHP